MSNSPHPVWTKTDMSRKVSRFEQGWKRLRSEASKALAHDLSIKGHRHPGPAETPCPDCPKQKEK